MDEAKHVDVVGTSGLVMLMAGLSGLRGLSQH